jgi:uncharacterized protein YbjQ (UPF0145 family)
MREPILSTTAFAFDGYRVTQHLGLVRGIIVRSRSIVGNIGAALQTLIGGNITIYTISANVPARMPMNRFASTPLLLGANAVIGLRYDATEIAQGVAEVLCYATAVVVEEVAA